MYICMYVFMQVLSVSSYVGTYLVSKKRGKKPEVEKSCVRVLKGVSMSTQIKSN